MAETVDTTVVVASTETYLVNAWRPEVPVLGVVEIRSAVHWCDERDIALCSCQVTSETAADALAEELHIRLRRIGAALGVIAPSTAESVKSDRSPLTEAEGAARRFVVREYVELHVYGKSVALLDDADPLIADFEAGVYDFFGIDAAKSVQHLSAFVAANNVVAVALRCRGLRAIAATENEELVEEALRSWAALEGFGSAPAELVAATTQAIDPLIEPCFDWALHKVPVLPRGVGCSSLCESRSNVELVGIIRANDAHHHVDPEPDEEVPSPAAVATAPSTTATAPEVDRAIYVRLVFDRPFSFAGGRGARNAEVTVEVDGDPTVDERAVALTLQFGSSLAAAAKANPSQSTLRSLLRVAIRQSAPSRPASSDVDRMVNALYGSVQTLDLRQSNLRSIPPNFATPNRSIKSLILPAMLESVSDEAFFNCAAIEHMTSLHHLTRLQFIGEYAFSRCERVTSIKLPSSVTSLSYACFYSCMQAAIIDLSALERVASLPGSAFVNCQSAVDIRFSPALTEIGSQAFAHCASLVRVDLEHCVHLATIQNGAFTSNHALTQVKLPASIATIGAMCFKNCPFLTRVFSDEVASELKRTNRFRQIKTGSEWADASITTALEKEFNDRCNLM